MQDGLEVTKQGTLAARHHITKGTPAQTLAPGAQKTMEAASLEHEVQLGCPVGQGPDPRLTLRPEAHKCAGGLSS